MFGGMALAIHSSVVIPKKARAYMAEVCDSFNKKYEEQRGVRIEQGKVEAKTAKGATYFADGLKITVKQPGVPIPGVELFTPCRESAIAIQSYKNSNDPNGALAAGTPSAPPAYVNPYGTPMM